MLDDDMKAQLKGYLQRITRPIVLAATVDQGAASREMLELLRDVAGQSGLVSVAVNPAAGPAVSPAVSPTGAGGADGGRRVPSFRIERTGSDVGLAFAGLPTGHEFTSLVLALLQVGGYPPKLDADLVERIRGLAGEYHFETYMSLSCQSCPDVVQALNAMAVLNPRISHTAIDGALFQEEVQRLGIMAVPSVYLNGAPFGQGRMGVEEVLAKLNTGTAARDAARLEAKAPFDVLIVGGGPAGAAAAIYAARKGIRTGIVAERIGGQVLDTLGIENFISVAHTEGPRFAAGLEDHVRQYEVEIMNTQRAGKLLAPGEPGAMAQVQLANGARLSARTVILATGARWRNVNVPGEQTYRNRGVAYCPHCDGPLYKGKRVAVIGGGNSGVEAAIDLAGIVAHVTLIEFAPQLKADAVLVARLKSLGNVAIHANAQTTEITGDGERVKGLRYTDRASGQAHHVDLAGVFVQIGLVPNTEWLEGSVELSRHGEIVVDAKGQTSVPGVFAAGDATTSPYKQIIIAAGDGAKAALSAFDHLIRAPRPMALAALTGKPRASLRRASRSTARRPGRAGPGRFPRG
jgi:alkyl hydroperoxide reductase subunit F